MDLFRPLLNRFFPPIQPIPAGVYHYQAPPEAPFPYRLHLRVEPDGRGLLLVNASTVVHLNQTATEYAYHLVQNTPEEQAITEISRRYQVDQGTVRKDYQDLIGRLRTLVDLPDLDPVTFLDFGRSEPYTGAVSAPYRLDCALTYHLPEDGKQPYAPIDRVKREMTSEEWSAILDKAWNAGIPHVIFTGGEPTLRPDLCKLIGHAENLGMVTGLLTNGLRLAETRYLHELLQSGLDHMMILLNPGEDQCWEALRDTLAEDIAVVVHQTLTERNLAGFDDTLDRLVKMGVENVSLSTESLALKNELAAKRQALAERHLHLIWDLPVPYSQFHPVALELADESLDVETPSTGPGQAWLYVEPDGDVLPGQGHYQAVLGNLLTDSWEGIWQQAQSWKENQAGASSHRA